MHEKHTVATSSAGGRGCREAGCDWPRRGSDDKRRFLQQCRLLAQRQDMIFPVARCIEPGKGARKGRVIPASGQPSCVMNHAQGSQCLDKLQFPVVKLMELQIAIQYLAQLQLHVAALTREQHPQVLYCRAAPAVIQIDKVRAVIGPENVAGMAVTMQADYRYAASRFETVADLGNQVLCQGAIGSLDVCRQKITLEQETAGTATEAVDVQRRPVFKRACRTNGMD